MKRAYLLFTLLIGCIHIHAAIYNVKDFGAKADGKTIDSPAINRAIEAAAEAGGGTVYLPAGEYACYSIRLKSNRKDTIVPNRMNITNIRISDTAIGRIP